MILEPIMNKWVDNLSQEEIRLVQQTIHQISILNAEVLRLIRLVVHRDTQALDTQA